MTYRTAVIIGLIATIVYFDVTKEYNEQIWQCCEDLMFWKSNEELLIGRCQRMALKSTVVTKSFFIGFNGNIDTILNGHSLMKSLGFNSEDVLPGQEKLVISSVSDLLHVFTYYFYKETAAERSVVDDDSWNTILEAIGNVKEKTNFIGGNAALIAKTMSSQGVSIKLAVPGGPELKNQLKDYGVTVMTECQQNHDEFHIIMEYAVGEQFAGHKSKRANRFIFSKDVQNSEMSAITCLTPEVISDTDVVVIAGFHMLETQTTLQQHAVLNSVRNKISLHKQIHLELASMTKKAFLLDLFEMLIVHVHSLGLNEAELDFLSLSLGGDRVKVDDVSTVKAALVLILEKTGPSSKLSRIHFHCLTYHIIIERRGTWRNGGESVAMGAYSAARFACDRAVLQVDEHELRVNGSDNKPVISEMLGRYELHSSPVLVCKQPLRTVGLGDSISATGLLYTARQL